MSQVSDLVRRVIAEAKEEKIKRDAFLYLEPTGAGDEFAQCATCVMWSGPEHNTCYYLGKDVDADDSCGLYAPGKPNPELAGNELGNVSREAAGFVDHPVRCENCMVFDGKGKCLGYEAINKALPEHFDLDVNVKPKGCCNAQRPK
jgi:hypothetical protein